MKTVCKHGNTISIGPAYTYVRCAKCDAEQATFFDEIEALDLRHQQRNKVKASGALAIDLVADIRRLWADHEELLTIASQLRDEMYKLLVRKK